MTLVEYKTLFYQHLEVILGSSETNGMWKYMQVYLLDKVVPETDFIAMLQPLKNNYPIQYLVNETYFYDSSLFVNEDVLIPRPETEELVHTIITDNSGREALEILDVGTGSGCIISQLGKHLSASKLEAIDISQKALIVAQRNSDELAVSVNFHLCDVLKEGFGNLGLYDIIVSNPPYIDRATESGIMSSSTLKFEPDVALFGPENNFLEFYEVIAKESRQHLKPGGNVYVELNENFAKAIQRIFIENHYSVELIKDMQGKLRILKAWL